MVQEGVSAVEFDVYYSKDKVPIVFHGDLFGKIEEDVPERGIKKGMKAKDVNYEDLLFLDIGEGERVPTLKDVISFCKNRRSMHGFWLLVRSAGRDGATSSWSIPGFLSIQ